MSTPSAGTVTTELSLPQRILRVFSSPSLVFQQLRDRPRTMGALLSVTILFAIVGVLTMNIVEKEQLARLDEKDIPAEQREQAEMGARMAKYTNPVTWALIPVFIVYVGGGLLLLLGKILGGHATYRQVTAGTAHTLFVMALGVLVTSLMLAQGKMDVQTSLAALLPTTAEKTFLYNSLAVITDVFELWRVWLTVLVVAIIMGVARNKAAVGIIGVWIVVSLGWAAGLTALAKLG